MSIDEFLSKEYHLKYYNCGHFVAEVWLKLFKQDISNYIANLYNPKSERKVVIQELRIFEPIKKPKSPCIVLLHGDKGLLHVGIFYSGRLLHITESGVKFELLETISVFFKKVSFYNVKRSIHSE